VKKRSKIVTVLLVITAVSLFGVISTAKNSSADKFVAAIEVRQRSLLSVRQNKEQLMRAFKKCYAEKKTKKEGNATF